MVLIFFCFFALVTPDIYVGAECPEVISKKHWNGIPPVHTRILLTPVELIVIQHTVTQTCTNDESCAAIVREIQETHVNRSYLWDIGPSFLIGGNGKVYEGRGWNRVPVHTPGFNNHSLGIAFIGDFETQEPRETALETAKALLKCGVELDRLTQNHSVVLHNQLVPTASPGKHLIDKIKLWPNWKADVTDVLKLADVLDVFSAFNIVKPSSEVTTTTTAVPEISVLSERVAVLETTKDIDLLSNWRNAIAELIRNLRRIAQLTLKTVEDLLRNIRESLRLFINALKGDLRKKRLRITETITNVLVPSMAQCTKTINDEANSAYDTVKTNTRACADKKIDRIVAKLENLKKLSNDALEFGKLREQHSRNCTENNYGIKVNTKICLNNVFDKTQVELNEFESKRTMILNLIRTDINDLPSRFRECTAQNSLDPSVTETFITRIATCTPTIPKFGFLDRKFGF